jgi:hypothetical protein
MPTGDQLKRKGIEWLNIASGLTSVTAFGLLLLDKTPAELRLADFATALLAAAAVLGVVMILLRLLVWGDGRAAKGGAYWRVVFWLLALPAIGFLAVPAGIAAFRWFMQTVPPTLKL